MRRALGFLLLTFLFPAPAWSESELETKCKQLGRDKSLREAIQLVDKYEAKFPKDAGAVFCRGTAKFMLGDQKGAISDLEKAYRYDPTYVAILKDMVVMLEKMGNKSKMCETWSFFKFQNMRAPRSERFDPNSEYGRKIDRTCSY